MRISEIKVNQPPPPKKRPRVANHHYPFDQMQTGDVFDVVGFCNEGYQVAANRVRMAAKSWMNRHPGDKSFEVARLDRDTIRVWCLRGDEE